MLSRLAKTPSPAVMIRPFTIAIEGNIGCGKTTFLKHFEKNNKDIQIAIEPVSKWQNIRGHNLLQLMYDDPKKWSFPFQTYVQLTMLQMHSLKGLAVKMMERSLHSARHCFVENLSRSGIMAEEEKVVLDEWYQWLKKDGLIDVDLIVYLRSSPEVVFERLKKRGRIEESNIPLTLLKNLHDLHEGWLTNNSLCKVAPVLIVDADQTLEEMSNEYVKCHSKMNQMLVSYQ